MNTQHSSVGTDIPLWPHSLARASDRLGPSSLTPLAIAVRDKRAPYLSPFSTLRGGQANLPALSYLSHISVIIFVRKRQIASDG